MQYRFGWRFLKIIIKNKILLSFNNLHPSDKTQEARRYIWKYEISTNLQLNALCRPHKVNGSLLHVPTYEEIFDVFHLMHTDELGHPKD